MHAFLGKMKQMRERHNSFLAAINDVVRSLTPVGGSIASAVATADVLEYLPLEPVVEDWHEKGVKKKVALVFDDLNRSQLGWNRLMGVINEYCENKGFATIVIGDTDAFKPPAEHDIILYKTVKEKIIARTVRYTPDYPQIVHHILTETTWESQAYADFLRENEDTINDAFSGDPPEHGREIQRYHHFRSLCCALQEFGRLYEVMEELQVPEISQYLYSFIVYMILSRNGINRNGRPGFQNSEEEIRQLYPRIPA